MSDIIIQKGLCGCTVVKDEHGINRVIQCERHNAKLTTTKSIKEFCTLCPVSYEAATLEETHALVIAHQVAAHGRPKEMK